MIKKSLIVLLMIFIAAKSYAQVAKIPFEFFDNKYIIVHLGVNDSKDTLNFYFDTGATSTLVDSTKAVELGLKPDYEQSVSGAGGSKVYKVVLNQTIFIADKLHIDSTHIVLDDLARLQSRLGRKFDGIIGYSILKDYKTRIDFDHKVIELYPFNVDLDISGYTAIDFDFLRGIPIPQFPVTIELKSGQKLSDTVFFDSGAGLSLLINTPFKIKNNLPGAIGKTITSESENLSSKSVQQEAVIQALEISRFKFRDIPVLLSSDKEGVSSYDGYLGILGSELIKRFNTITDYSEKKLYLKPNSYFNAPFEHDLSGIGLKVENGKVKVSSIVKESEAFGKGLRENDTIVSINNKDADIETYRAILRKDKTSVKIKYLTDSGKTKEIKITLKRLL